MKLRKIFAGMSALAIAATMAISASAEEYKAQIMIQTGAWSYRNKIQDETFGDAVSKGDPAVTDWNGKFICWGEDQLAHDWNTIEGNSPITFEDATITGDGTYTVKLLGDLTANSDALNILGVSTNLPRVDTNGEDEDPSLEAQKVVVTVDKATIDGADIEIPGEGKAVLDSETEGQLNIILANQWNDALGKAQLKQIPKESIEITFTVKGLDAYLNGDGEATTDDGAGAATDTTTTGTTDTTATTDNTAAATDNTTTTTTGTGTAATGNTTTGASAGLALAGLALAGAAVVVSKKR